MKMNKYYEMLEKILNNGAVQTNKKGGIRFLINECISLCPADLLLIFEQHQIARKKLKAELQLFCNGVENVQQYRDAGITWWDYCQSLKNSYPTYFAKLPALVAKINAEMRPSKNYVLFLGETGVQTDQLPCLSCVQFQLIDGGLYLTAFQRSSDANLGLPADIYTLYLISQMINAPLRNITIFFGNVHIYTTNVQSTYDLLGGKEDVKFSLNV